MAAPSLIDGFMPRFDVVERHAIRVDATLDQAFAAVERMDLGRSRPIRVLFAVRGLGSRRQPRFTLDDAVRMGFVVLAEEPGTEIVLGLIGRFWTLGGGLLPFRREDFESFSQPGYAKAAWNFRIEPGNGFALVSTETRVRCTDQGSRRKFLRYWRVVAPFSGFIRARALRLVKRDAENHRR